MKKTAIKTGILAIVVTTMLSCEEKKNKQEIKVNGTTEVEQTEEKSKHYTDVSFSNAMAEKVFRDYQQLRKALIASDADEAQTAAKKLAGIFSEEQEDMKSAAMAMADTEELEKQRELFSAFTQKVEPLFTESIAEGTIYQQFCPMAFEGKGGYWISNVEEIENPYYGKKMLKCGKVVAKIQ